MCGASHFRCVYAHDNDDNTRRFLDLGCQRVEMGGKLRRTLGRANQGNCAVGVPESTGNAGVEWDVPSTGFTLTGRVADTGKQAVNVANTR